MSSELSANAVYRILTFFEDDDCNGTERKAWEEPDDPQHPRHVNQTWNELFIFEEIFKHPPPTSYLRSLQFALFLLGLQNDLDDAALRTLFGYGNPLIFDRHIPPRIVSKVIEFFQRTTEEPLVFDITLDEQPYPAASYLVLEHTWPEVYKDHLPCAACTKVEQTQVVVEQFHFPSKHFNKLLTVELRFVLDDNSKHEIQKIILRVEEHLTCSRPSNPTTRTSRSHLLVPEFATEVYSFLDRADAGTSLIANGSLTELIQNLRHRLPVHHLRCEFVLNESGHYSLNLHHIRGEPSYDDTRHLYVFSKNGSAAVDCALIRRYMSSSHVSDFTLEPADVGFSLKMIAALVCLNFSVGCLRLQALDGRITDYCAVNAVFGGALRLNEFTLSIREADLGHLVKTTDFWRLSTTQSLSKLLILLEKPIKQLSQRQRAITGSPLWISGIHLLSNCAHFHVNYDSTRHMESIGLKLVRLCEGFERGEFDISATPQLFTFSTRRYFIFPFNGDNLATCECSKRRPYDLHRFQNAVTGEWLFAYVVQKTVPLPRFSVLHLKRGSGCAVNCKS